MKKKKEKISDTRGKNVVVWFFLLLSFLFAIIAIQRGEIAVLELALAGMMLTDLLGRQSGTVEKKSVFFFSFFFPDVFVVEDFYFNTFLSMRLSLANVVFFRRPLVDR